MMRPTLLGRCARQQHGESCGSAPRHRVIVAASLLTAWALCASPAFAQSGGAVAVPSVPQPASITLVRVVYDAAGTTPSVAMANRREDFTGYFYSTDSLCTIGRDSAARPADAGFGWEVAGRFVSRTPSEVIVQLTWTRVWEDGKVVSAPSGSVTLALHPGDRVPIDRISASAIPGKCTGVGMTLSVEFSGASVPNGVSVFGGRGGGGGRAGGIENTGPRPVQAPVGGGGTGTGSGAGFGGGGGFVRTNVTPDTSGTLEERAARTLLLMEQADRLIPNNASGRAMASFRSDNGSAVTVSSALEPQTLQTVTVDLWLIDRLPSGVETSQHQTVQTIPGNGAFAFDPVALSLPDAVYGVGVKGFVQAQRLTDGSEKLEVGIARQVNVLAAATDPTTASTLRMVTGGTFGGAIPMPKSGDVISLEMPTPRFTDLPLGGHQFSLRVRVVK